MKKHPYIFVIFFYFLCSCGTFNKSRFIASDRLIPLEKIGKKYIFEKYKTTDNDILYYFFPSKDKRDPLILTVQGSGCNSIYSKDNNGNVYGGLHTITAAAVESRAAILAVEKPNIETFQQSTSPTIADTCSVDFRQNFNRNSWVKALVKTLNDVISSHGLQPSRIIVIGHSEGASIGAAVSALVPQISHVIFASGGGGNPLYEAFLRRKRHANGNAELEDNYIKDAINDWQQMAANPNDTQKLYWGHTARYWISQSTTTSVTDLKRTRAKIYIIQGTNDQEAAVDATDLLVSELVIAGKDLEYKRIIGANHSYEINGERHIPRVIAESLEWALTF